MTSAELKRLQAAIDSKEGFIAVMLPGEKELRFVGIHDALLTTWPGDSAPMPVATGSTSHETYIAQMENLIGELRDEGGKTVICRNICGTFSKFDPAGMADSYFNKFPDTLRFIFRQKECGFWMGATPELLLEYRGNRFYSRALAGTRPAGTQGQWSEKNLREHTIVTSDIVRRLCESGLKVSTSETGTLRYGDIEHLCTPVEAEANGNINTARLIETLHPTPAVGGFPRQKAMERIRHFEQFPRNYYGGVLGLPVDSGFLAYVILRVVHFDTKNWCVYTGSGITAASDPEDEWNETCAKAAPLLATLAGYS